MHSAKVTETGRIVMDHVPHFSFSITAIGKGALGNATKGPQDLHYNLATKTRKDVREWIKALGKTIIKVADLPEIRHRVHKASRHKVRDDFKAMRLVVRHKHKGLARRKPSAENMTQLVSPRDKEVAIGVPSISLHPTDRKWVLSDNNFSKVSESKRQRDSKRRVGVFKPQMSLRRHQLGPRQRQLRRRYQTI